MSLAVTSSPPALRRGAVITSIPDAHFDGDRTTVGVPMVGDPWIDPMGGLMGWRQAQYATAMAQKLGLIGPDASQLAARSIAADTVVFVAIETRREVARFTIPARVMAFNPHRQPLQLADQRDAAAGPPIRRSRKMKPRPLTPAQSAILRVLQRCVSNAGMESAVIAANHFGGRYAKWSTPKLKALARRGLAQRDDRNLSRWYLTPAGSAYQLTAELAA